MVPTSLPNNYSQRMQKHTTNTKQDNRGSGYPLTPPVVKTQTKMRKIIKNNEKYDNWGSGHFLWPPAVKIQQKTRKTSKTVEKNLSSPRPIRAPTIIEDIKSKEIFKPILYPFRLI